MKPLSGRHRRAKEWGKKDKTWEDQARKYASAFHRGAVKSGASARNRLYRATHGEFSLPNPGKGVKVLLLLGLVISGIFIVDQWLKTGEAAHGTAPHQTIWQGTFPNNDLNAWNCRSATFNAATPSIYLDSNTTHSAGCISKETFDISVVSGKDLYVRMTWAFPDAQTAATFNFGYYFTRNSTLPTERVFYNPRDDENVALVISILPSGASGEDVAVFIQRNAVRTINQDDFGCVSGSVFICGGGTRATGTGGNFGDLMLNFTGNPGSANSVSWIRHGTPFTEATSAILPWLEFQGQQYHMGIFANPNTPDPQRISFSTFLVQWTIPSPSVASTPPQNIDTGGFFGPLIRALISLGVWILNGIAEYLGFVADVFVTAMNAVGAFFGLGNVGTAIRDFLTGTANFIINVVTTVFGWGVTFASLFQNGVTFIANFLSGSNGFIAWIISFFTSIAGLWTIIQDVWNALNTVVFTMNQILVVWYLVGMFWVYMDGWPGFKNWIDLTDTFLLKLLRGGWWVGREITQVVLDVKRALAQWL